MPKKINVIGIGGTGMRCLESFIYLCSMGMFDDYEVFMLALDTDARNGNFRRVRHMIEDYNKLSPEVPAKDTFFSAKINYYEFSPKYDGATFNSIINYSAARSTKVPEDNEVHSSDLVDLFLTEDVRNMNLEHGYRAQTQMGSLLMYRAIVEEAIDTVRRGRSSSLKKFIDDSGIANNKGGEIFIFGSVFGGTGASSIPILPRALDMAVKIFDRQQSKDILANNKFGTVVLTNYFTFTKPEGEKVAADASFFALNSQSALMFYETDKSVKERYNSLYLIGNAGEKDFNVTKSTDNSGSEEKKGVTGGEKQQNPVHFIELLAAFAAYDFFKHAEKREGTGHFFFMDYDQNLQRLDFANFTEDDKLFKQKFGAFTAAALTDARGDFFAAMVKDNYRDVDEDHQLKPLQSFFRRYLYLGDDPDTKQYIQTGWAQQMSDSVHRNFGESVDFLLHHEVFQKDVKVDKKKYNERMFAGESPETFSTGFGFGDSLYSKVRNTIQDEIKAAPKLHTTLLQLIKDTHDTFMHLYFPNSLKQ